MPQEFLRDVLRTGDAVERRQRRLSVLPISIAAHVIMLALFLFSPWGPDVQLPLVASPIDPPYLPTVPPPPAPPPPATRAPVPQPRPSAPIVAPEGIREPEEPTPPVTAEGGIAHGPGVDSGQPPLLALGGGGEAVPPPPPLPPPTPKLVRVGGVIREPRKIVNVPPVYPEFARTSRVEGIVTLEAIIDATGRVESVKVLSAQPLLADAAVRAVKQWRYSPTELNGVPVPVLMTITVRFTLSQ